MSLDISLNDPVTNEVIELDFTHHMTGGTYVLGGTREAWLNITSNYYRWYFEDGVFPKDRKFEGVRSLYGMTGAESIPVLKHAISSLESMTYDLTPEEIAKYKSNGSTGYWLPTRANAIKPLYQLLAFAQLRPDGVWDGD